MYGSQVIDMTRAIFDTVNQLGNRMMFQGFELIRLPESEISRVLGEAILAARCCFELVQ